jgi:hypothetical protein
VRIEAADLSGDARVKGGGVKESDGADAALAGNHAAPHLFRADATPAKQADARYDDTAVQGFLSPGNPEAGDYFFECFSI